MRQTETLDKFTVSRMLVKLMIREGLSQQRLGRLSHVSQGVISNLIREKHKITANIDEKLCQFFEIPSGSFLKLQKENQISCPQSQRTPD